MARKARAPRPESAAPQAAAPAVGDFDPVLDELERATGGRVSAVQSYHHARFHEPNVVYHVLWRTFQGRMLLTPCRELNEIAAGVIARAQRLYGSVRLYSYALMTNHCHAMLQGPPEQVPAFIGFIKREISRRWGTLADWPGTLWSDTYYSTALPTEESQVQCFEYILAQGVKEGLVAAPEEWPGVHIAHQVIEGRALRGKWLDGTAYGKALFKDRQRETPVGVDKATFVSELTVRVDTLPCWEGLAPSRMRAELATMRRRIIRGGRVVRGAKPPCSRAALQRRRFEERSSLPTPPWWQERRRLVCWARPEAPETRDYLLRYWEFQRGFRVASGAWRTGEPGAVFPLASFRPGRFESGELAAS